MYASLLALGWVLFGQVTAGDRYPAPEAAAAPRAQGAAATPAPQAAKPENSAPAASPATAPQARQGASAPAPGPAVAALRPADLIRDWAKPPMSGQLTGMPTTLGEALRDANTRADQTERTKAYWDLSARVIEYYLALRDSTELEALRGGVAAPGEQWDAKRRALDSAQEVARQSARAAQIRLQQALGRSTVAALPLPADLPHAGKYNARYDEIFASRNDPAAAQLNDLLPLKYDDVRNQARLVSEAYSWLDQVSKRREPNSDGTGLLRAHELLALQRRALVESVREYNQEIVTYTELAAPSKVGTDRLVAMLIHVSTTADGWRDPSGVQQASALADVGSSGQTTGAAAEQAPAQPTEASGPRTYLGHGRTEVRRPAFWRLRNREHSIVVDRLFPRLRDRE